MKKLILQTVLILCIAQFCFSQETKTPQIESQNVNELKINALFLIIGAFDLTYERTLSEESALGVSLFIPFDDEIGDDLKYYISPYYRFYFGKKYAAGLFVEGFGMLNRTNSEVYDYNSTTMNYTYTDEDVTDFALGFGIGGKWLSKSGFILELSAGIGRNLFNNIDTDFQIIGKGGINLGYRF